MPSGGRRSSPFFTSTLRRGGRGLGWRGVAPPGPPHESMQLYIFEELYRKIIHQDGEILGMEILIPVWRHRDFIDRHRYDHREVATLLLVTTEETLLDDLIARKVGEGAVGDSANTH